jgi:hypothetical protein
VATAQKKREHSKKKKKYTSSVSGAFGWYGLALASSLPYIWFFVVVDWRNPHVFPVTCWVYDPLGIWVVPTLSFAWDVMHRPPLPTSVYLARSLVELVVFFPVWLVVWVFVSFFLLGGGWI